MSKRTKRERRRPATDAPLESNSRQNSNRQYSRFTHRQLVGTKPKRIRPDLPDNMPRPLKRALAKSIARLERLVADGKDVPGIQMDYHDTDGGVSTFLYIPGPVADQMAEDMLAALLLLAQHEEARA
jgi:hypothetical protein